MWSGRWKCEFCTQGRGMDWKQLVSAQSLSGISWYETKRPERKECGQKNLRPDSRGLQHWEAGGGEEVSKGVQVRAAESRKGVVSESTCADRRGDRLSAADQVGWALSSAGPVSHGEVSGDLAKSSAPGAAEMRTCLKSLRRWEERERRQQTERVPREFGSFTIFLMEVRLYLS